MEKKHNNSTFERMRQALNNSTFCYSGKEKLVAKENCKCHCEGTLKDLCQGKQDKDRFHQRVKELEQDPTINSMDMMYKVLDKEFEGSDWYKYNVRFAYDGRYYSYD